MEDVDGDGDVDLLFHFDTQALGLTKDSVEAIPTGNPLNGTPIRGADMVNIVPK